MVEHHHGPGERLGLHQQVAVAAPSAGPAPVTVTTVGRDASASAGTVITVASSKLA